jgi:hypothetical protein
MNNDIVEIDNIFINSKVINTKFTCDLNKCKGACCTMESILGAPLEESEINEIEELLPLVMKYLPGKHKNEIKKKGFWEKKKDQLLIKSFNNRDCVFVYYDVDIARCAIEKVFLEKKTNFRKPLSCHLFPIRVAEFGGAVLRYEVYSECNSALEEGTKTGLRIIEFCKEALERAFGKSWYNKLRILAGI